MTQLGSASLLDDVLAPGGLVTLFQPIVEWYDDGPSIFAFECLTRGPAGTNLYEANVLFEYLRLKGMAREADAVCVATALRNAAVLLPYDVTVNVHATSLSTDNSLALQIAALAAEAGRPAATIVVEIIEHAAVVNERQFLRSIELLRKAGFRIAVDDIGTGHSTLKTVVETRPDFCKVDRYFVDGVVDDPARISVIESLVSLSEHIGGRVVAEGVESLEVAHCVKRLGVDLLQGHLFARPLGRRDAITYIAETEARDQMEAIR